MSAIGPKQTWVSALQMSAFGGKRTWAGAAQMSAFDPKRTLRGPYRVSTESIRCVVLSAGVGNEAARVHHAIWRPGSDVAPHGESATKVASYRRPICSFCF